MGHGIKLTEKQWDQLDQLRLTTQSAAVFRNCLIILMSDSRDTIASIARRLGCGTDTVVRIRRLYRIGGIKALYPIKPPGRPSRATPQFIDQMKQAVQTNPLSLGYGFSTWSAARLAKHLDRITGIHFSDDQMRRLLHQ
ncbi:MAG: helix-turn-helix domain-containing protein [Planctomycetota bacterium]